MNIFIPPDPELAIIIRSLMSNKHSMLSERTSGDCTKINDAL